MKKISILFLFIFIVFSCSSIGQQSYASHRVTEGETVSEIANKYNVTVYELYRLNPEARGNLYPGLVLILPGTKSVASGQEGADDGFKWHTVEKGQTVYRLSKIYDIPEEVIKKYNKHLYSAELRTGEKIRIPLKNAEVVVETLPKPSVTNRKHIVKPKETKYGLAAMYGITIEELEGMNPEIKDGLQIGAILDVPDKSYTKDAVVEESKYGFYEVKPGENLFRLTRRWNISESELIALNPALEDGLKSRMVLKIPKSVYSIEAVSAKGGAGQMVSNLTNLSTKNVALMLPFNLGKTKVDTADVRKNVLKQDKVMRLALDFYSGALMAIDSARALGISTNLNVYDTGYRQEEGEAINARKVEQLIRNNDFSGMDVVIGPLLTSNVEKAAGLLRSRNIPVVSPIVPNLNMSPNMFQSRPTDEILRDRMLNYLKIAGSGKNVVIIADDKNQGIKNRLLSIFPNAKVVNPRKGEKGLFLYANDISSKISENIENWVILETNDIPLISNVTTDLSTQVKKNQITLLTTLKGNAYNSDDISNLTLMNLNFHFPSVDRDYGITQSSFLKNYKKKYGFVPNNYAVRGFDLMFDTLLRLATAEDLYDSAKAGYVTEHVENRFDYIQAPSAGYLNQAGFIVRYGPELIVEEVEIPVDVVGRPGVLKD